MSGALKPIETPRLDPKVWIEAALSLLSEQGIDGVRIEPLAKRLGVTKGSFYWHFRDRDALFEAMLTDWRRRATVDIIDRLDRSHEPAPVRLRRLLRLPFSSRKSGRGAEIELSVRLWARRDPRPQAALEEIDQLRLGFIARLLEECGVPKDQCTARAVIAYSYIRVATTLVGRDQDALMEQCEDLLMKA